MAQQIVNVGNTASDGTGDELRDAFTKINQNFTELFSGNVQITAANIRVYSVAGRDGNVVLTVNDIAQAASKSYVNTAIASNIALLDADIVSLNANITASNNIINNHSNRLNTLESNAATQAGQISNLNTIKADVTYVDSSIELALSSNAYTANIASINANISAANLVIANHTSELATLTSNAGVQATLINVVNANVSAANSAISSLQSNAVNQESAISSLRANITAANAQIAAINVSSINANITAVNVAIAALQSNALIQALEFENLWSNAVSQGNSLNDLVANAASQQLSIVSLQGSLSSLVANDASQANSINNLISNAAVQASALTALTANATIQSLDIDNLYGNAGTQGQLIQALQSNIGVIDANLGTATTNINTLLSNAVSQQSALTSLTSNAASQATLINTLTANATSQALLLDSLQISVNVNAINNANIASAVYGIDANLGTATLNIAALGSNLLVAFNDIITINNTLITKANIDSPFFTGNASFAANVYANNLISNANVFVTDTVHIGLYNDELDDANLALSVTGNVAGPYRIHLHNLNPGTTSSSDILLFADDGDFTNNFLNIGINSSTFAGNWVVPAGDTGLPEYPRDGYFTVVGGNIALRTDSFVYIVANTSIVVLEPEGDLILFNTNLRFRDGTTQSSAIQNVPALYSNIGNLSVFQSNIPGNASYTPNNAANYNGTITNIQQALDELAARLRALGG